MKSKGKNNVIKIEEKWIICGKKEKLRILIIEERGRNDVKKGESNTE